MSKQVKIVVDFWSIFFMFIFFILYKSHKNLPEFLVHKQNDIIMSENYLQAKKKILKS